MKTASALACACLLTLTACGGGGGGSDQPAATQNDPALIGTWIASTDGHYTGSACGLTIHGAAGERITMTFEGSNYSVKYEACVIVIGNTGGYVMTNQASAAYHTGGIFLETGSAATRMTALDLDVSPPYYTAYNVTGSTLTLGFATATMDGSSAAKRAYIHQSEDPLFIKQ